MTTDRAAWRARVDADLKGAPFDKKLVSHPAGRPPVQPLYTAEDLPGDSGLPGQAPYTRGSQAAAAGWEIRVRVETPSAAACRAELDAGATGLHLVLDGPPDAALLEACTGGLSVELGSEDIARALLGGFHGDGVLELCLAPDDPALPALAGEALSASGVVVACTVDGSPWHHQGVSEPDDLALSLAAGLQALRALEADGMALADAFGQIAFRVRVDTAFFDAIAKLRALRALWSRIARACGEHGAAGARIHVLPSRRVLTRRDAWVNLLRNTAACFAGAVGGAEAITTLPLDHELGAPAPQWQRLARNTQVILARESHLGEVQDPAGGSFFLEARTRTLMEAAWTRLQALEEAGGLSAARTAGLVDRWAAEGRAAAEADVARRKRPITGVSAFPQLDERTVASTPRATPLPEAWRLAAPFEALRDRSEASSTRPVAFLAQLGSLAEHTGRSTFARNLLQAGGITTVDTPQTIAEAADPAALGPAFAAAAAAGGCKVAVLCGTDDRYAEQAVAAVTALRAAGAAQVWLAGRPGDQAEALAAAGLTGALHLGADVLEVLERTWEVLS